MGDILTFIIIGLLVGLLSGMFGVGGGVVIVPSLIFLYGFTQLKAQGTSLAILLPPAGIFDFIEYYKNGHVDIKAGILIVIFVFIGSFLGAKSANNIPIDLVKKSFAMLTFIILIKIFFST